MIEWPSVSSSSIRVSECSRPARPKGTLCFKHPSDILSQVRLREETNKGDTKAAMDVPRFQHLVDIFWLGFFVF